MPGANTGAASPHDQVAQKWARIFGSVHNLRERLHGSARCTWVLKPFLHAAQTYREEVGHSGMTQVCMRAVNAPGLKWTVLPPEAGQVLMEAASRQGLSPEQVSILQRRAWRHPCAADAGQIHNVCVCCLLCRIACAG